MNLHERAAEVLGWKVEETRQFSLLMLREMVRDKDPQLAKDIERTVNSGQHIFGAR